MLVGTREWHTGKSCSEPKSLTESKDFKIDNLSSGLIVIKDGQVVKKLAYSFQTASLQNPNPNKIDAVKLGNDGRRLRLPEIIMTISIVIIIQLVF